MVTKLIKSLLVITLFVVVALSPATGKKVAAQTQRSVAQHRAESESSDWIWSHSDNGIRTKIHIKGKVEFSDDYRDIVRISEGGWFTILDERGGSTRRFEARSQADGTLKQSYSIAGVARSLDADGRAWLSRLLLETVRQSGYDAERRVARLLKQTGVEGVFAEVSQIKGDYAKKIYFVELMKQRDLNTSEAQRLMQQTAREVGSDYEKAQILLKAGEQFLGNQASRAAYLEGVNSIHSDYEKSRVLQSLLRQSDLSQETLVQIVKTASRIASDYEKTNVLLKVAAVAGSDANIYNAMVEAAQTVSSDYEKSRLLLKAVEVSVGNDAAQAAYLKAARTLRSDYEKSRVLQAALHRKNASKETLRQIIQLADAISSDYEKAQVLVKVAALGSGDEELRNAMIEAAKKVSSEYERGRILNALFK